LAILTKSNLPVHLCSGHEGFVDAGVVHGVHNIIHIFRHG
jgi:hypothetical protein